MSTPKTISIVVHQGLQLTDLSGPMDVFSEANSQTGKELYRLEVVGTGRRLIESSSGVRVQTDRTLGTDMPAEPHTLLVAGTPHFSEFKPSQSLLDRLSEEIVHTRRYGSVCSGTFLLAATGKIDRRRVTTHWAVADQLARQYPSLKVEKDALYVRDGRVRTAAGVTAGMDLALALVAEDASRNVAKAVASHLVMFFKRPGGQLQFSRDGEVAPANRATFQELQRWVVANPGEHHSVPKLAQRVGLSTRHFARLFRNETGMTPAQWVEAARIEAARTMLESASTSPKQVAVLCGFADVNVLRRAFKRQVGVSPAEYSKRFR